MNQRSNRPPNLWLMVANFAVGCINARLWIEGGQPAGSAALVVLTLAGAFLAGGGSGTIYGTPEGPRKDSSSYSGNGKFSDYILVLFWSSLAVILGVHAYAFLRPGIAAAWSATRIDFPIVVIFFYVFIGAFLFVGAIYSAVEAVIWVPKKEIYRPGKARFATLDDVRRSGILKE